jgi:hypothetical protein
VSSREVAIIRRLSLSLQQNLLFTIQGEYA